MPIGTILIFSLFANNLRTAGPIGMGEALIDVTNRYAMCEYAVAFASDTKSDTLLQFNECDS